VILQFRSHLQRDPKVEVDAEGQHIVLRATFPGIRESVKEPIGKQMDALARQFAVTHDMKVKEEIEFNPQTAVGLLRFGENRLASFKSSSP
jgi:hypothetical protein